jgi:amidase
MEAMPSSPPSLLTSLNARDLAAGLQHQNVSCRELMRDCLAQIERLNPTVNALVSLQPPEDLLRQADACDAQIARGEAVGRLHGFPMAPKDLAATAGLPTSMGSPIFARQITAHDAIAIGRQRRAGAIFVGRSNTPEFGLGSHTYNQIHGITRNAWNPDFAAGGSSGGAAVALALDMLPVADGSDMMGSLRNPAACNQAGHDASSPLSLHGTGDEFAQPLSADLKGKRIAWLGDLGGHLAMAPGVMALCESALRHFDTLGCTVDAALPDFDFHALWTAWIRLRGFIVAGNLQGLYAHPATRAQLKPEACWEVEQGQRLTVAELHEAAVTRTRWHGALLSLFEHFDYLALPAAQVFPLRAEALWPQEVGGRAMDTYHRWMEVTIGATLAGLPAMAIPAGFSDAGLPMGLQLIGKPQADLDVLQLAHGWHQAVPFAGARSPLLAS